MIQGPVVILANGDFPSHPISLGKLQDANTIICCDGSVNNLVKNNMEPQYILGDMDSIDDTLKKKYNDRIIKLPEQDENDLIKAIRWAESKEIKEVAILGATGKREDHTLSNIFILLQFPTSLKCTLITDNGNFSITEGTAKFQSFNGQQISIFSVDPEIKITSTNLKYNLNLSKYINLYCGSLNESLTETFTLSVSHGKILVYQVFA